MQVDSTGFFLLGCLEAESKTLAGLGSYLEAEGRILPSSFGLLVELSSMQLWGCCSQLSAGNSSQLYFLALSQGTSFRDLRPPSLFLNVLLSCQSQEVEPRVLEIFLTLSSTVVESSTFQRAHVIRLGSPE